MANSLRTVRRELGIDQTMSAASYVLRESVEALDLGSESTPRYIGFEGGLLSGIVKLGATRGILDPTDEAEYVCALSPVEQDQYDEGRKLGDFVGNILGIGLSLGEAHE